MEPEPVRKRACRPDGVGSSACHPEEPRHAMRRGIRNLCLLLFLLPLVVVAPGCESLPAAPNIPPTATFIFNPVSPINAGETAVTFNAAGSRDSDGTIASYNWSWGDGTVDQSTTTPTIVHVFADTPSRCIQVTYSVLLTVVDDKGDKGTASQQVTVTELPAPGSTQCK
jgi:PKD repeat protein